MNRNARLMSPFGRPRLGRRRLSPMLVIEIIMSLCLSAIAAASDVPADIRFEQFDIGIGADQKQTLVPGFFLPGTMADLAVVSINDDGDRWLRIYSFDGAGWVQKHATLLRPEVLFVDVADIGGRDRLITYEHGRLNWFDPDNSRERALLTVATRFNPTDVTTIPHIDITRDLNGDGRDDIVLPDVDGFWIATQLEDGSFSGVEKLGPAEPFRQHRVGNLDLDVDNPDGSRTYGEAGITAFTAPWYLSRVHTMDYDQDGRSDLVFWNSDHFDVYLQDASGRFQTEARTFTTDVLIDSAGAYSRSFAFNEDGVMSILFGTGRKSGQTVLHSLRDMNGDAVADLVTLTLSGRSIAKQQSVYAIHFGTPTPDGIVFAHDASSVIESKGKAGAMQPWGYASQLLDDFNGDGYADLMLRDVNVGLGGMSRTLVGNSVPINLEFYRSDNGIFEDNAAIRRKVRRFAPFAGFGNVFFPAVLMGDINGDGFSDLVAGKSPKQLHIYPGVAGPELLAEQPRKVEVALPFDERKMWLVDLNRDGKDDILIHRGRTECDPDEAHQVTLLIAQ